MKEQIEFDFSKWGQPGITVQFKGSNGLGFLKLHQHPINKDGYYGLTTNGHPFSSDVKNLQMYYEQIPREVYINVYPDTMSGPYLNFDQAKLNCNLDGKTTTFREVIE